MGAFIAKQPNGLYCRFSTVVDTVTDWNMTEEDYVNLCVAKATEQAIKEAKETLANHLYSFETVKNHFFPSNNTIEGFEKILKEMGDNEGLGKDRIKELNDILNG
jgi:hypothetical protein